MKSRKDFTRACFFRFSSNRRFSYRWRNFPLFPLLAKVGPVFGPDFGWGRKEAQAALKALNWG